MLTASVGALDAVAGLAHDLDARLDAEQHRQAAAEELLVVDHEHPDRLTLASIVAQPRRIMTRRTPIGASGWSQSTGWPVRATRASIAPRRLDRVRPSPRSSEITP